jgi:hypothetical protein
MTPAVAARVPQPLLDARILEALVEQEVPVGALGVAEDGADGQPSPAILASRSSWLRVRATVDVYRRTPPPSPRGGGCPTVRRPTRSAGGASPGRVSGSRCVRIHPVANATSASMRMRRAVPRPTGPIRTSVPAASYAAPMAGKSDSSWSRSCHSIHRRPPSTSTGAPWLIHRLPAGCAWYSARCSAVFDAWPQPSSNVEAPQAARRPSGESGPSPASGTCGSTTCSACGPSAAKERCGWALRRTSAMARNVSGTTPTPRVGVRSGR